MSQVVLAPEPSNPSYWSIDVAGVVAGQPYQFSIVNKGGDDRNPGGYLLDHARMLLNEYRGDGLRFDMAHTLTWACTQHKTTRNLN